MEKLLCVCFLLLFFASNLFQYKIKQLGKKIHLPNYFIYLFICSFVYIYLFICIEWSIGLLNCIKVPKSIKAVQMCYVMIGLSQTILCHRMSNIDLIYNYKIL